MVYVHAWSWITQSKIVWLHDGYIIVMKSTIHDSDPVFILRSFGGSGIWGATE